MSLLFLAKKRKFTPAVYSPLSLFAASEQGAWYDPSDLTTLFQDSAGTTPVTLSPMEQPVGLMRDKSGRGNHAFQATAGNRPLLSARVNLLTKTEDFSDGVWYKGTGCTATASVITSTAVGVHCTQPIPSFSSITKFRLLLKVGKTVGATTFPVFSVNLMGTGATTFGQLAFNTNTGNYGITYGTPTDIVVVDKTTYWELSYNTESGIGNTYGTVYIYPAASINGTTYNAGVTGSVTIYGVDLRPTNAGSLLPPYQRVNTATDYDTVGFPLYLNCTGISTSMATSTVDFTVTDKMTIISGVRKMVTSTFAPIVECGATDTTAGAFTLNVTWSAATTYATNIKGTTSTTKGIVESSTIYGAPTSNVVSMLANIGATAPDELSLRINGASGGTQTGSAGTGTFGNFTLNLFNRPTTSLYFRSFFYGAIIRGAQSDTASVVQTENYMAKQTGITF